jgi:hypothetical protein
MTMLWFPVQQDSWWSSISFSRYDFDGGTGSSPVSTSLLLFQKYMLTTNFIETDKNIAQLQSRLPRITNTCTLIVSSNNLEEEIEQQFQELAPLAMFVVIKSSQIKPVADPKIKLKGQNIKVAGYGVPPHIYKEMGEFVGLDVDILQILADKYDFMFTVYGSNGWGQPSENGTWSGTIGEVHDIFIYSVTNQYLKKFSYGFWDNQCFGRNQIYLTLKLGALQFMPGIKNLNLIFF